MTKEERISEIIDQAKKDITLLHKYSDIMGYPQPDSIMDTVFDELQNRSSMLFAAWLPQLANVKEYSGDFTYRMAFDYIYLRARQELGQPVPTYALVGKDASREEFIKALEDWEVKYGLGE